MSCTFQLSKAPKKLLDALHEVIPQCDLLAQQLPETPISLWLIPPVFPTDRLDDEVIRRIWSETPYWTMKLGYLGVHEHSTNSSTDYILTYFMILACRSI